MPTMRHTTAIPITLEAGISVTSCSRTQAKICHSEKVHHVSSRRQGRKRNMKAKNQQIHVPHQRRARTRLYLITTNKQNASQYSTRAHFEMARSTLVLLYTATGLGGLHVIARSLL